MGNDTPPSKPFFWLPDDRDPSSRSSFFSGRAHSCTNPRKDASSPVKCVTKGYEAPPSTPFSWSARMSRMGPTLRHHVWYMPSGSRTVQLRHSPCRVFRRWMMAHWSSAGQSASKEGGPGKPASSRKKCSEKVKIWLGTPICAFADCAACGKRSAENCFRKQTEVCATSSAGPLHGKERSVQSEQNLAQNRSFPNGAKFCWYLPFYPWARPSSSSWLCGPLGVGSTVPPSFWTETIKQFR